jgi:uncharacterized protein YbjT (DUF2867 family)
VTSQCKDKAREPGRRTAVVLGATGGVGGETAAALLRHGWRVKALARNSAKATADRNATAEIEWLKGDALDRDSVVAAARDTALIVYAVKPAGYRNWGRLVLPTAYYLRRLKSRSAFPPSTASFSLAVRNRQCLRT